MSDFTFKNISEKELLSEAPDNANVFVEVDGAMKRVPKSEVGGAGGYVITVTIDTLVTNSAFNGLVCTLNYDEAYEVLKSGGNVWVDISMMYATNTTGAVDLAPSVISECYTLIQMWKLTDIGLIVSFYGGSEMFDCLLPNGSHNITT